MQYRFFYVKAYRFPRRFSHYSRRGGCCRPWNRQRRFPLFFRVHAEYNRGEAVPASGRMEGDRREAVVEDSSIAQAIYNPCRRHQNFKRLAVNFSFITYGRTIGARTPLAFKNSPPFASERSPSLRREVQPTAKFQRFCLLK